MLTTDRVDLPAPIEVRLKRSSEFVDNIMEFAREDLIGFRRPIAATFAFTAPFVCVFAYMTAGIAPFLQITGAYFTVAFAGIYLIGREQWPHLVTEFEARKLEKRRAAADLKCGFGEASFLTLERAPRYFEYEYGVLVLVDSGDFRTLFLSIDKSPEDPRWDIYRSGDLARRVWRWMRLPVSRELVQFTTEASRIEPVSPAKHIRSIDAWEAVHAYLGEPLDGSIIHRPFSEVVEAVERMV